LTAIQINHGEFSPGLLRFVRMLYSAQIFSLLQGERKRRANAQRKTVAIFAAQLLDDFPEYPGDGDVTEREQHGPHQRRSEQENHGMGEPQPEVTVARNAVRESRAWPLEWR
jgi:hypothetical protein